MAEPIPESQLEAVMDSAELDPHAKERMREANKPRKKTAGQGAEPSERISFDGI